MSLANALQPPLITTLLRTPSLFCIDTTFIEMQQKGTCTYTLRAVCDCHRKVGALAAGHVVVTTVRSERPHLVSQTKHHNNHRDIQISSAVHRQGGARMSTTYIRRILLITYHGCGIKDRVK